MLVYEDLDSCDSDYPDDSVLSTSGRCGGGRGSVQSRGRRGGGGGRGGQNRSKQPQTYNSSAEG